LKAGQKIAGGKILLAEKHFWRRLLFTVFRKKMKRKRREIKAATS
jgi:hypothetical protein